MRVAVVGAGIFGVTAADALARRGWEVVLVDPGPLPHPDAASTDISKLVRMDYGADAFYAGLMERALDGWDRWNAELGRSLYHEDGILVLARSMEPGGFEGDSLATLESLGRSVDRLDGTAIGRQHPRWTGFSLGYRNRRAGWAESGAVVAALLEKLRGRVELRQERALGLLGDSRVRGLRTETGEIDAEHVVVAAGAWIGALLPELSHRIRAVGQPVMHFAPRDPSRWRAPDFPPWAADIANTGWYGFPANEQGLVKVANHGPGVAVDPHGPRLVADDWEARFRQFFADHLPDLVDAPRVGQRLCLYADSFDGDFWIDRHPDRDGVVVAGGGSGHGFKFAPILGELVLRAVDGDPVARFRWRDLGRRRTEDARHGG